MMKTHDPPDFGPTMCLKDLDGYGATALGGIGGGTTIPQDADDDMACRHGT